MTRRRVWIAGSIVLAGIAGCGNFPLIPGTQSAAPLTSLKGDVSIAGPLDSAKIVVETASGEPVEMSTDGATSLGRFFEQLSLSFTLTDLHSTLPLIVKVTGGTVNGVAFEGTLLGYMLAPGETVHVNILTTLIVKYQRATGVTLTQAERNVTALLGIPADVDLASKLNDPNFWFHFNPRKFMIMAPANGGFDMFTDRIIANMTSTQPVGDPLVGGAVADFATKAGKWLFESTGEGLVAWGVGKGMDWILSACGYQSPTDQALDDIKNQLTQVNATLTTIQSEISTLSSQMTALLNLVQLSWDSLTSTISSLNMSSQEGVIQNQYNNMISTFNASYANLCTPAGATAAANFAAQILGTYTGVNYDIDQQIYDMYANIAGKNPGSQGALYDLTSKLVDQVKSGQDPFDAYNALQNYFAQLAAIQTQGLNLMIEALNQPLPLTSGPGLTTFQGTATQYYTKFYSQMSDEVEVFLLCVDRLVVAAIDVRSEIAEKFAYMSPETAAIYAQADFVASQFSTRQPTGLIVRLIGDPAVVSSWVTNQSILVGGQVPTVIAVNGANINNYAAKIPATTPNATHYLTWTQTTSGYSFKPETNISIVKLQYASAAPASFTVTTPTQTQTLSVNLLNQNFQQASNTDTDTVTYGSGVFYVHPLPTWQAGTSKKTDNNNQWDSTFTPDPADASLTLHATPGSYKWWETCDLVYTGQILGTISNGTASNATMNIVWNGTQNTTYAYNWKPTGKASENGGSVSLICQTTTQASTGNNQPMTMSNVAFAPNTNTNVVYQGELQVHTNAVEMDVANALTTNAFLSSLEIVPTN